MFIGRLVWSGQVSKSAIFLQSPFIDFALYKCH